MLDKMVEVRQWEEFVLIHLSCQIELDEPWEVVSWIVHAWTATIAS